jgi:hypothetical protein
MEPPGQLRLELRQNLLYFRELFHNSNLGNLTRTEIAHNVEGLCGGWAFMAYSLAKALKLYTDLKQKDSYTAQLLQNPCLANFSLSEL